MAKSSKNNTSSTLEDVVLQIQKQYGEGSIVKLGDASADNQIDFISTGALTVDMALGIGGVPRGRIIKYTDQNLLEKQH